MANEETGPAWERLEDQLGWYERKSEQQKRWFQWLKVAQIVIAASIPVAAAAGASAAVAGALGAVIVVLEGIQQLFQFQQNWISYRVTAEALKREKSLYLAGAGPYAEVERPVAAPGSACRARRLPGVRRLGRVSARHGRCRSRR